MSNEAMRYEDERDFHYEKKRGGQLEMALRSRFAVVHVEDGEGTLQLRGSSYGFSAGDVLVITDSAGCVIDCGEDTKTAMAAFKTYFLSEALRDAMRSTHPIFRSGEEAREVSRLIGAIGAEIRRSDEVSADVCRAYAAELSAVIVRAGIEEGEEKRACPAVESVIAYVREHPTERLSLSDMASIAKVSTAYLSRKFKSETGTGYADYVATMRLERAESMLREKPNMSVTEVAFACGFNDSNYFSDKFKKHFGISPLKFRKQAK